MNEGETNVAKKKTTTTTMERYDKWLLFAWNHRTFKRYIFVHFICLRLNEVYLSNNRFSLLLSHFSTFHARTCTYARDTNWKQWKRTKIIMDILMSKSTNTGYIYDDLCCATVSLSRSLQFIYIWRVGKCD